MKGLQGTCIVVQSGAPTSVINASLLGVVKKALENDRITAVYGSAHGIKGVIEGELYDLGREDRSELELLMHTPSSALGSCRYRLEDPAVNDADFKAILATFRKYGVRYFFLIGGNTSMDICMKIDDYMRAQEYDCRVVGIPKTIDNTLMNTDHCPGYGSAAKYVATTMMELHRDASVYGTGMITLVEVMGRNAGWLTAAASLAARAGSGPELIYMPEVTFDLYRFIADVMDKYKSNGNVLVAVSEGIKDKDGVYIAEYENGALPLDSFGHPQMGGAAAYLARQLKGRTDAKVRAIELSLIQRCAAHTVSARDLREAYEMGASAVNIAVIGVSGVMVTVQRVDNSVYHTQYLFVPLKDVANLERKFPADWITNDKHGISEEFVSYVMPLIEGDVPGIRSLPRYANLKLIRA